MHARSELAAAVCIIQIAQKGVVDRDQLCAPAESRTWGFRDYRRTGVMGFNRRKLEDQRREAADRGRLRCRD